MKQRKQLLTSLALSLCLDLETENQKNCEWDIIMTTKTYFN